MQIFDINIYFMLLSYLNKLDNSNVLYRMATERLNDIKQK